MNNTFERAIPSLSKEKDRVGNVNVMKFGGASLENTEAIVNAVSIVRREQQPIILVLSAMRNATDKLDRLCRVDNEDLLNDLINQHYSVLESLQIPSERRFQVERELGNIFQNLINDADLARHYGAENHPNAGEYRDRVLSSGERLVVRLFSAVLNTNGISAEFVDSSDIIETDSEFGQANPDFLVSSDKTKIKINPLLQQGIIPVITGFVGSTRDGRITTLGRNTSDYSASLIGKIVGARQIIFWKEVNGLYDRDPKLDPGAQFIEQATFDQVAAMNTKVIHAKAFKPLLGTNIVVFIKNFKKPEEAGTKISRALDGKVNSLLNYQIEVMRNTGQVPRSLRVFKADSF